MTARERRSSTYHWLSLIAISCYHSPILSFLVQILIFVPRTRAFDAWKRGETRSRGVRRLEMWQVAMHGLLQSFQRDSEVSEVARVRAAYALSPPTGRGWASDESDPQSRNRAPFGISLGTWHICYTKYSQCTISQSHLAVATNCWMTPLAEFSSFLVIWALMLGPWGVLKGKRIKVSHVRRTKYCTMK